MALVKLKISSYDNMACRGNALGSIDALINPEDYSRETRVSYRDTDVIGDSGTTKAFRSIEPHSLSLNKLVVDGTGIISLGSYSSVDDYVDAFRKIVCDYNGNIHQANYLMVVWGNMQFTGVCTSFKVSYTMLKPDGTALRAVISLKLSSSMDPKTKTKAKGNNSPDLTHFRTVKAGDTLPLMTYRIYGDSSYYLEVARVNGLQSIHALKPGDQIYFPPLKK